ncbi:MAG: hypothetical protein LH616_09790, partial [Ilumatobacteraceae bacterium]|nr:hypothetical protein [Ilumatobacteraceae bacterium]
ENLPHVFGEPSDVVRKVPSDVVRVALELREIERAVVVKAEVLAAAQATELLAYRDSLNPAQIGREIADLQSVLLKLAKNKTEQLYLSTFPSALPDIRKGIRLAPTKTAS